MGKHCGVKPSWDYRRCTEVKESPGAASGLGKERLGGTTRAPRYYPEAQIRQGGDGVSAPPRRVCSTGRGFRSRRACLLLFTRIVSRVDVIDRPRPNAMDLKDGL